MRLVLLALWFAQFVCTSLGYADLMFFFSYSFSGVWASVWHIRCPFRLDLKTGQLCTHSTHNTKHSTAQRTGIQWPWPSSVKYEIYFEHLWIDFWCIEYKIQQRNGNGKNHFIRSNIWFGCIAQNELCAVIQTKKGLSFVIHAYTIHTYTPYNV